MKRIRWKWVVLFLALLVCSIPFIWAPSSPKSQLALTRALMTESRQKNSNKYARMMLEKAQSFYDSSMLLWQIENKKLFFLRDFDKSREYARNAAILAQLSGQKAEQLKSDLKKAIIGRLESINTRLSDFNRNFGKLPQSETEVKNLSKAKLLLREAELAFDSGDYVLSDQKLSKSEVLIHHVYSSSEERLTIYFNDHSNWSNLVQGAIIDSKKHNEIMLIIDKFARKCFVYQQGKIINSFDSELGPNWMGDKQQQGDKATPEGTYRVIHKKQNGETKFYKALLLDYPNEDDRKRFNQNKTEGLIPAKASIGNLIEIHGHGGQGTDWTDGCIALSDNDMDKLFAKCSVGTRVVIVGSVTPLNKLEETR